MNYKKIPWVLRAIFYKLFTQIGLPSYIGEPVFVSRLSGLKLGKRVRIYPGMRAEIETPDSYITIGDNVSIGQNLHVVSYDDTLEIGSNVTISANVMVTNCDHCYSEIGKHILEQPLRKGKTIIGDNCFLGYGCVILAGTILGKQCVVGANSVVRGVFPDGSVIAGNPGKIVRKYNASLNEWEKQS